MEDITVGPAYGRDYPSKAKAIEAWNQGKDFTVLSMGAHTGRAVNKADAQTFGVSRVTIRYKRHTMAVVINADGTERR